MYHANYLTYTRRAIESAFGSPAARIHCLHHMKYRAAATLGETAIVEGSLISCDPDRGTSRWRFQITAADPSRVFVSGEATLSWSGVAGALPPGQNLPSSAGVMQASQASDTLLLYPSPDVLKDSPKTLQVVVWSDDLEGRGDGECELSIRAVLNYFERIRTLSLGRGSDGELGLTRLHSEGTSIVVRDYSFNFNFVVVAILRVFAGDDVCRVAPNLSPNT